MTTKEKSDIKSTIQQEIMTLKKQIAILEDNVKPIVPDCSLGRLTRIEAMKEQDVTNKILDEARLRYTRLKNALLRIDHPMFGICIECEEEIGIKRLSIRPESVRCVECADKM